MLSRLATRASVVARQGGLRARVRPTAALSTAPVAKDDAALKPADVSLDGPLIRYGLTDWKVTVPAGIALAVPFLANEWIILSEEVQLVAAFVAFSTTVSKYAGAAIAKNFDERQEAIISEINRVEDIEIKLLKETIEAAKLEKTIVEDLAFLDAKSTEVAAKLEATLLAETKHKVRDQFVRWLDSAVAAEKASKKEVVDEFLDKTSMQVAKNFASDAKLKKAAVDQVISILKDPKATQTDLVGAEFEKVGKKLWDEIVTKGSGTSKDSVAAITSEFKALKSKSELNETDLDNAVKLYYSAFKAGIKPSALK